MSKPCSPTAPRTTVKRLLPLALTALALVGCLSLTGCFGAVVDRLGGLVDNGPSSFGATYTAADKGSRPDVTPEARNHFVDTSSAQTATVLIYMVGSDLESVDGDASDDIDEMMQASLEGNVRILLQTGGCTHWQSNVITEPNGRYEIVNGQIKPIEELGTFDTLTVDALADFISWGASYAPADRIDLILWDHGGGTFAGFGTDQHYPESTLMAGEITQALEKAQVKLDFLGFDACLMGTLETAYAARNWADYLIASEESEVGYGWSYTDWLCVLAETPSVDTVELGKVIADDFVDVAEQNFGNQAASTLSVIDLTKIDWLYSMLGDFFKTQTSTLNDDFTTISAARANTKEFGDGDYDQIDIIDYLDRFGTEDSGKAAAAVESTVAYSATSSDMQGANGLAMYYPYTYLDYYSEVCDDIADTGFGGDIKAFFDAFTQIKYEGYQDLFTSLITGGDSELPGGVSGSDTVAASVDESNDTLTLTDKGDYYALKLTDEQWETIVYAELWVYVDDGEGYIDLGSDDTYAFDDDGDLKVDFDKQWITLDGQIVPYYAEGVTGDDEDWYEYGYVPALLNNEDEIEIMIYTDASNRTGEVVGYRDAYSEDEKPQAQGKGYQQFQRGDTLDFECDYYDYQGNFDDVYLLGDQITYNGLLAVGRDDLSGETVMICYMLRDVYGNQYYTENVELS